MEIFIFDLRMNPLNFVILLIIFASQASSAAIGFSFGGNQSQPQAQGAPPIDVQRIDNPLAPSAPSGNNMLDRLKRGVEMTGTGSQPTSEAAASIAGIKEIIGPGFNENATTGNVTFSFVRQKICVKTATVEDFVAALKKAAQEVEAELAATTRTDQAPIDPFANPQNSTAYDPRWKVIDLLNCPNSSVFFATKNIKHNDLQVGDPPHVPEVLIKELENLRDRLHTGSLQIDRDQSLIKCTKKIAELVSAQINCGINDICTADHLNTLKGQLYTEEACKVYYMKSQIETMFSTMNALKPIPKIDLIDMLKGVLFRSMKLMESIEKDSGKTLETDKVAAREQLEIIIKWHGGAAPVATT